MRLIDADMLESKQKTIYMQHENVTIPTRVISIADLHLAPTVDAEPVRHSRWTEDGVCMNCGMDALCFMDSHIQLRTDFCPNCGAKMDAEVEG